MALLVPGRTVCPVCGNTIEVGDEVVSLPLLTPMEPLSDASVHRACMHDLPETVKSAWWEWWTQTARQHGGCEQAGVLAYVGRRSFSLILRDEFLVLEEEKTQLQSVETFLRSPSPSSAPSSGWLNYQVDEGGISIRNPLTKMAVFKGRLSDASLADALDALSRLAV